ncbi:MAG: bifunctional 4-hydroxy-2-oxoglutarate aldolase/2-dehydro-3-deoxy-phosphogluconate aldolase [Clostridia bacterium]|nr:bifunctional 4-hydroxy-2-oxoglutarate aldolase/2-dehydro-3-deoxy-phosphogluconate aldolase [Clostridia bacterium]
MKRVSERIETLRLVPVIKLNDANKAVPLARALAAGNLPVAEVTFRTDAAEQAIRNISRDCPELLVGAGTITTVEQAKAALGAGADFIVTPGVSGKVIDFCQKQGVPIYAGICTPSEIMQVLEYGLHEVKFFPAGQYGGLNTIKALSAPFPNIRFMPTGGVSEQNVVEYLSFPKVFACGGSWMVPERSIDAGNFSDIVTLVTRAVRLIRDA